MSLSIAPFAKQAVTAFQAVNADMPIGTAFTAVLSHGTLQVLAEKAAIGPRLARVPGMAQPAMEATAAQMATNFFYKLVDDKPYPLSDALIAHITAKGTGLVYNTGDQPSPDIVAPMTFVGQFIDHDLTLNAVNLLMQTNVANQVDEASPKVDLDSVFGPRVDDDHPSKNRATSRLQNGMFDLHDIQGSGGAKDVPRGPDKKALIGDKRNDENQIILQIHLLMMRLNNALLKEQHLSAQEAQHETILHWQSFVATQYLPLICRADQLDLVHRRLKADPMTLLHHPVGGQLRMPHEFAIGFRFGHSQLRDFYHLQDNGRAFPLFDVAAGDDPNGLYDLRGSKYLAPDHVIDWEFFLGAKGGNPDHSNLIDTKVNEVVFDLPASAIPDADTQVVNLPQRNLIRSNGLGLCAGEDLVARYNAFYEPAHQIDTLTPDQVVTGDKSLFEAGGSFRTPLWYYILREAELQQDAKPGQLGKLGSRLVAEVVLAGIHFATPSFLQRADWTAKIPVSSGNPRQVELIDIARFAASA